MANKSVGFLTIAFGADLRGFEKAMKKAQRNIKRFGDSMQRTGKNLTRNITLPVIALGSVAVKTFMSFEQSMLKVKAVSGATDAEFKTLTETAKKLGASTMFTASQVADLQFELAKLGFSTDEINASTESILRLSQATTHDLAESGEIVAATLNSFNMEASEASRVADVFALASSNAAIDMTKLSVALPKVGAISGALNMDIETLTASMMTLADRGVEASKMGTSLRKIFLTLAKEGMTLSNAFDIINSSTTPVKKAQEIFGDIAANSALILAQNTKQTIEYEKQLRKSAGTATKMAEIMDSGTGGALRRLKSAMEGVAIDLGQMLIPLFEKLMNIVQKGINFWKGLDNKVKSTIVTLGLVAASIGPILTIVGSLTSAFALLLSPVGLVVGGLVAGGILIVKNWGKIKKPLVETINYFIDLYNESMLVRGAVNLIVAGIKNTWAAAKFAFSLIFKLGQNVFDGLKDKVTSLSKIIKGALTFDREEFLEGIMDYGKSLSKTFLENTDIVKEETKKFGKEIADNYKEALDKTLSREKIDFITEKDVDNTVSKAQEMANKVLDLFKKMFGTGGTGGGGNKKTNNLFFVAAPFIGPLNQVGGEIKELTDKQIALNEATKTFENVFSSAMTSAAYSQEGFFKSFLENLKQAIKQMLIQLAITTAIKLIFGGGKVSMKDALGTGLKDVLNLSEVPALSSGGIVTGPTMALIGEGNESEAVLPLSKLNSMINNNGGGTQQVEVFGRISGNDIFLANQRGSINRFRSV